MGSHSVRVDRGKNRLYLSMTGAFSLEEAKACADDILAALGEVKPGFAAINDITGILPQSPEALLQSERVYGVLAERGVRRVIRVVRDVSKGTLEWAVRMEKASRSVGYAAEIATSIENADEMLDHEPPGHP